MSLIVYFLMGKFSDDNMVSSWTSDGECGAFQNTSRYVKFTRARSSPRDISVRDDFGKRNASFRFFKEKDE